MATVVLAGDDHSAWKAQENGETPQGHRSEEAEGRFSGKTGRDRKLQPTGAIASADEINPEFEMKHKLRLLS